MTTPAFIEQLNTHVPVMDGAQIVSFGDPAAEALALSDARSTGAKGVVCVVPELIRLRFSGRDRASFLHNFCTNDIKGLSIGSACEVIFTNVKARVLGHGYILADTDTHELWMLPGDATALFAHLNRYIITEDVSIERVPAEFTCLLLTGAVNPVLSGLRPDLPADGPPLSCQLATDVSMLRLNWQQPGMLVCLSDAAAAQMWPPLAAELTPGGRDMFEHLRIAETFPRVGTDLTSENLAVEAGRSEAISYVKGCYLGQEPIARIDAMGQVNRQLQTVLIGDDTTDEDTRNQLTSSSQAAGPQQTGIAMLSTKAGGGVQPARTPDGRVVSVTVCAD